MCAPGGRTPPAASIDLAIPQHNAIVKAIKRKPTPPQNTALGGDIYIHGNGASSDWTWGCVALENEDIKELFALCRWEHLLQLSHDDGN